MSKPKIDEPKIDEAAYREGQAAFRSGATLRSIVEQMDGEPDEIIFFSSALGFADALLAALRAAVLIRS